MKNDPTNDKERIKADILKEYPYLKVADGKTTSWALAAKNIRLLLKKNFPDTRFTVRSSSFAGGSSVCVSWKMTDWSEDAEEDFSENPLSLEPVENQVKKSERPSLMWTHSSAFLNMESSTPPKISMNTTPTTILRYFMNCLVQRVLLKPMHNR